MEYINFTWVGKFTAMASPCEVIADCDDALLAHKIFQTVRDETLRIEAKFSRYRSDNIIAKINQECGEVTLDEETARLIDYAEQCFNLSDGMFDITSGVLREVWRFDGGDNIPEQAAIDSVLSKLGWSRLSWQSPILFLPKEIEIDLGGIGKEYAVDRSVALVRAFTDTPCLVNLGGDVAVSDARRNGQAWVVGIEDPKQLSQSHARLLIKRGAIATSGDARRYLLKDGKRYSHILNPKTGWPIENAPSSVTVIANNCTEAGMFATFAMLQGAEAETFLKAENVQYQIQWGKEQGIRNYGSI